MRFIWNKDFKKKIKPDLKLLYLYIYEHSNNAGLWDIDLEQASLDIGKKYLEKSLQALALEGYGLIKDEHFFTPMKVARMFPRGVNFNSVSSRSCIQKLKEKDLYFPKDNMYSKWDDLIKAQNFDEESKEEIPDAREEGREKLEKQVSVLMALYPTKGGGEPVRKEIKKALKKVDYTVLVTAVKNYAHERAGQDQTYTKSQLKFYKEEKYLQYTTESTDDLPTDSIEFKISKFFYQGVSNWSGGLINATQKDIQAGARIVKEILASQVEKELLIDLIKWIDKYENNGFRWRDHIHNMQVFKDKLFENKFHDFVKEYKERR